VWPLDGLAEAERLVQAERAPVLAFNAEEYLGRPALAAGTDAPAHQRSPDPPTTRLGPDADQLHLAGEPPVVFVGRADAAERDQPVSVRRG
jgi:hypothetical protein